MKLAVMLVRVLLGAWLFYNGISYWLPHMPSGFDAVAVRLMAALVESRVMLLVKLVEIVVGVMLVLDLYVPLALLAGLPVVAIVAWVCLVLEWPRQRPMIGGLVLRSPPTPGCRQTTPADDPCVRRSFSTIGTTPWPTAGPASPPHSTSPSPRSTKTMGSSR